MSGMHEKLEWLARNVSEWLGINESSNPKYKKAWKDSGNEPTHIAKWESDYWITFDQWAQARIDLGLEPIGIADDDEEECIQLAYERMNAKQEADMVNHPPHYQSDNGIECIDAIRAALGKDGFVAYCRGNVIKYSWRMKTNPAEDQGKAAWYATEAREALEE